jgi:hypothetical protein
MGQLARADACTLRLYSNEAKTHFKDVTGQQTHVLLDRSDVAAENVNPTKSKGKLPVDLTH